ncbi:MAG: hypothetical protein ACKOET_17345 [Verrucomicrobiota bacterium]
MNARKLIPALLATLSLAAVHLLQSGLNRDRDALGLTRRAVLENAPPVLAFTTVALGGFRGLIANALWIRTSELQEDGKYFEAVQLADWITKLQPTFSTVWVHLAWNMGYNISVKFPDPEDRWLWVQRSIELLRDEGLKYNPHDIGIHAELARHFHHKMGANLDDAHLVYKGHWADEMQTALGGGRPDYAELLHPSTDATRERVRLLRERYKLEPALMKEVDDTYGPLEWRLPETQAIYWATHGLKSARGAGDILMLRRLIFQPMMMAFQRGRLISDPFSKLIEFGPNLEIIPKVSQAYLDQINAEAEEGNKEHFGKAHRNFLKDAVYFLYTHGREREAQQWFTYIRRNYTNTGIQDGWNLDDYCISRVSEDVTETSKDRVEAIVQGMLASGYYSLAVGDDDKSTALLNFAAKIHASFMAKVAGLRSSRVRVPLTPLDKMKLEVLEQMLRPADDVNPQFQAALRTQLRLPANFGIPATNAPAPGPRTNTPAAGPAPRPPRAPG